MPDRRRIIESSESGDCGPCLHEANKLNERNLLIDARQNHSSAAMRKSSRLHKLGLLQVFL